MKVYCIEYEEECLSRVSKLYLKKESALAELQKIFKKYYVDERHILEYECTKEDQEYLAGSGYLKKYVCTDDCGCMLTFYLRACDIVED